MHISRNNRPDPLEEVRGEPLVLLHEPLVVLVHLQYLADSVRRHLSLSDKNLHKDKKKLSYLSLEIQKFLKKLSTFNRHLN